MNLPINCCRKNTNVKKIVSRKNLPSLPVVHSGKRIFVCTYTCVQKVSGHIHLTVPAVAGHGTRRILYIMKRTTPVGMYTYRYIVCMQIINGVYPIICGGLCTKDETPFVCIHDLYQPWSILQAKTAATTRKKCTKTKQIIMF